MPHSLPDWPRSNDGLRAAARLRVELDDFVVREELGFTPDGDGAHDWLFVEKRGRNTPDVAQALARFAGVHPRTVGYSGLKDRRAVTRQWFSVERRGRRSADWTAFSADGLDVIDCRRHPRKLRRGTHRYNHFRIVLRDLQDAQGVLDEGLRRLRDDGAPNYFGEQRFGRGAGNLDLSRQLFAGRRLPRARRSIALSAARSLIFNDLLAARVRDGSWNRLRAGDVANLDGSRSVFAVESVDNELESRAARLDLHPTGPLWGAGAPSATGEPGDLESQTAARHANLASGLEAVASESRRALRMRIAEFRWQFAGDVLQLEFRLDRGCFATAVVRELVDVEASQPRFSST